VAYHWIEILVAGCVGTGTFIGLPDSPGTMNEHLVKATLVGLVGILVPEVPLAEDSGSVPCCAEDLGKNGGFQGHAFTLQDGVGDPVLEGVAPGHDGGPGGGTGWADEESVKARTCIVKLVQVGCLNPWMAVSSHGSVALVVGDDEDNVGLLAECGLGCVGVTGRKDGGGQQDGEESVEDHWFLRYWSMVGLPLIQPRLERNLSVASIVSRKGSFPNFP